MRPAAFALAAMLLAAGCGITTANTPTNTGTSRSAAPPADGGSYTSPRDVVTKLRAAGIACDDYKPIARAIGAKDRGSCQQGDLVVSIYEREGDVQAQVEFEESLGIGVLLLTGRNWTINHDDRVTLNTARSVLGGTLVSKP
ncbi:hypothetical protein [Nonomuraea sp. GTA35]|uniref:hypothetical protein n=1 Tax=Nonomuraea sp. GTA35 TaxID=1676746 RepID=UPI0035C1880A